MVPWYPGRGEIYENRKRIKGNAKENGKSSFDSKKERVIEMITPMLKAFKINNFDYEVDLENGKEILVINNQKICCTWNSMGAIKCEVIGYLFVNIWCKHRYLGTFETQSLNRVKEFWMRKNSYVRSEEKWN